MKYFIGNNFREYSIFFWLAIITLIALIVTNIHNDNKRKLTEKLRGSFENKHCLRFFLSFLVEIFSCCHKKKLQKQ